MRDERESGKNRERTGVIVGKLDPLRCGLKVAKEWAAKLNAQSERTTRRCQTISACSGRRTVGDATRVSQLSSLRRHRKDTSGDRHCTAAEAEEQSARTAAACTAAAAAGTAVAAGIAAVAVAVAEEQVRTAH